MKKVLLLGLSLVLMTAFLVWAGGEQKQTQQMSPEQMMAQMKADFAKCEVCKTMIPYMDQVWWMAMKHEVHNLKNGALFIHSYPEATEKELVDIHTMCRSMETAGAGLKKMSAKEKEGKLCPHCQGWYSVCKAGANDEMVLTKTGSIELITSDNPKTVEKIHAMADNARQMFEGPSEKM